MPLSGLIESKPVKILVVDADDGISLLLEMSLRRLNHTVISRSSAAEGLEIARSSPVSSIFLADHMPQITAKEFCAALNSDPQTRRIPIILTTTTTEADLLAYAHDVGADSALHKPFRPEDVQAVLDGVLS